MNNILEALYSGHVPEHEQRVNSTAEERAVSEKIYAEIEYFSCVMSESEDDCKRLDELNDMYSHLCNLECMRTFKYAFRLGAMIMSAVFMEEGAEQ